MRSSNQMSPAKRYEELIASMPHGLESAIMKILQFHEGEENGIFKKKLIHQLQMVGFTIDERQLRIAVYNLRHQGFLIGALTTCGYFMVTDLEEFEKFANKEFQEKIDNMTETMTSMREHAHMQFGSSYQAGMLL